MAKQSRAGRRIVIDKPNSDVIHLAEATNDDEIAACLPVLRELRRYIGRAEDFVAQIRRQQGHGYRLLAAWQARRVVGCAGFSVRENLVSGRVVHIDELITARGLRSQGLGKRLIAALTE